jgi:hypothetical protein
MTLEQAIKKATLYFDVIGKEVKHLKKGKIRKVSRITAFKIETEVQTVGGTWDVAIFFETNIIGVHISTPHCYLREFLKKYEVISDDK